MSGIIGVSSGMKSGVVGEFPAGHLSLSSVAIVAEQNGAGFGPGGFASGSWVPRDIATTIQGAYFLTAVTGLFTLIAGTYQIDWICTAFKVNHWKSQLFIDGVGGQGLGLQVYGETDDDVVTVSSGSAVVTRTASSNFGINCWSGTGNTSDGLGRVTSLDGTYNNYCIVKIFKLA